MPIDPVKVGIAVSSGLSVVCATCQKYWDARDRGLPGNQCLSKSQCGSPLAGGDFHDYRGPMQNCLESWCFVCGAASTHGVRVVGKPKTIGMCDEHIVWLHQIAPLDVTDPIGEREIKTPDGRLINAASLIQKRKQSLGEFIYEVESYYAAKEGRELE